MTTQWFLLSMIGFLSGHQLLIHLKTLRVISRQTLARSTVFLMPTCFVFMFWMRERVLISLLFMLSTHLIPVLLMLLNRKLRRWRFQREILPFLDELLLKMRSGQSFRESLLELGSSRKFRQSLDLLEIPSLICFPDHHQRILLIAEAQELLKELRKMDQSSARVIEKAKAYRRKEKTLQRFRQKSSQVTGQVRAQALICTALYLLLMFWTAWQDPKSLISAVVIVSVGLFMIGIASLIWVERSFRWKL